MKGVTKFLLGYKDDDDVPTVFIINFFLKINSLAEEYVFKSRKRSEERRQQAEIDKGMFKFDVPVRPPPVAGSSGDGSTSAAQVPLLVPPSLAEITDKIISIQVAASTDSNPHPVSPQQSPSKRYKRRLSFRHPIRTMHTPQPQILPSALIGFLIACKRIQ